MFESSIEDTTITIEKAPENTKNISETDKLPKELPRESEAGKLPRELPRESEADKLPRELSRESEADKLPREFPRESEADKLPKELIRELEKVAETAKEVSGKGESIFPDFFKNMPSEIKKNTYSDLDSMKKDLRKAYGEIKDDKPPNSPNIVKWFDSGGSIKIDEANSKQIWTYIDNAGREVSYIEGYPQFPPEAKHPVIDDINIDKFTGNRNEDKKLYLQKLEEQYKLTEIPDGYVLHHDSKNGNMQLVRTDWHKEFTHAGGHSLFKEE